MPPRLKPVETKPNTFPNEPTGVTARTIMSRDGWMMPFRRPPSDMTKIRMADGMIVNYTHEIPQAMLDLVHAHHAPAVWINVKLAKDCVFPDDVNAARSVTEELIQLGHRRIAFAGGPASSW